MVTRSSGSVPLAPRPLAQPRPGFAAVALVQTAGGPLGGDEVHITVEVGPGAALELRTIAATLVLPGPGQPGPAVQVARVRLAEGARLLWHAEPVIVAAGARYEAVLDLDLRAGAAAVVRESVIHGRHGECGGAVDMRVRADLDGRPLLRDAVRIAADAVADSPAVLGGARAVGSVALLGLRQPSGLPGECELAGPGCLVRAVARDAAALEAVLAAAAASYATGTPFLPLTGAAGSAQGAGGAEAGAGLAGAAPAGTGSATERRSRAFARDQSTGV